MKKKIFLLFLVLVIPYTLYPIPLYAQSAFNHPEINWYVVETEHFKIMADKDLIGVAKDVGGIAEEIFPRVTEDIGYVPNFKVPIMLIDYDTEFNGSAEPLIGRIVIYCASGTKVTTGNLSWFRRVLAHEFSHVVTFGAMGAFEGFSQKYQILGALQITPIWFLEGIAQWEAETWDSHRDMFLRMTVLEGKLMPPSKLLGFAGSDIRESRLIYEQGHAFVRYISACYGRDSIKHILSELKKNPMSLSFAINKVLKKDISKVYEDWIGQISKIYNKEKEERKSYGQFSRRLTHKGGWMYHPCFSPDGKTILYASSYDYDYAVCDLILAKIEDNRIVSEKKIAERTGFFHSFSPDNKKIAYSKTENGKNGSIREDVYVMDIASYESKRLTYNEDAKHPFFSPDGARIAYVVNRRGITDIWIMNADGSNKLNLTQGSNYEQNDSPNWSSDGRFIAFSHFSGTKRDIAVIDFRTNRVIKLTDDEWDDRTPVFLPDSRTVIFTSDRNIGIPNLFTMKLEEETGDNIRAGEAKGLTNVLGGVFEPGVDPAGERIIFSGFNARGFDLYLCRIDRLSGYDMPEIDYASLVSERNNFYVTKDEIVSDTEFSDIQISADKEDTQSEITYKSDAVTLHPKKEFLRDREEKPVMQPDDGSAGYAQADKIYKYNSFTNIRPILILPAITIATDGSKVVPYGSVDLYLFDPLEKHIIYGYSYFDGTEVIYSLQYVNRQLYPTIALNLYQGQYSYSGSGYAWNRYKGNTVEADFPLTSMHSFALIGSFQGMENINTDTVGYAISNNITWNNAIGAAFKYFTIKERVDSDYNPAGGRLMQFSYLWSDYSIGSNYKYNLYSFDWREYIDVWRAGGHTIAGRLYTRAVESDAGYTISIPSDDNALRGIPLSTVIGNRTLAASIEYRFPVIRDIGANLLGFYFDRWYVVPFADWGMAWYDNDIVNSIPRYSVGMEYRFRFWAMSRYQMLLRFGIVTTKIESSNSTGGCYISLQPSF